MMNPVFHHHVTGLSFHHEIKKQETSFLIVVLVLKIILSNDKSFGLVVVELGALGHSLQFAPAYRN